VQPATEWRNTLNHFTFLYSGEFNMKLKHLVAALALVAAGSANASMDNSTTGNGSLILTVLDTAQGIGVSAAFDLGLNMNDFLNGNAIINTPQTAAPITTRTWNLATDPNYSAAWNSFVTAIGSDINSKYAVVALDRTDTGAIGDIRVLTTSNANLTTASNKPNNAQLLGMMGFDGYITGSNLLGTQGTVANGADFAMSANGTAYAGTGNGYGTTGKINGIVPVATAAIGTALNFYEFSNSVGTVDPAYLGTEKATIQQFKQVGRGPNGTDFINTFTLASNGTLTYVAAVPEPETYALMLAGLGLVGVVARRRKLA
jgi:hypothetical protein